MTSSIAPRRYVLLICLAVVAAFVSGIDGVFLLDDHRNIVDNLNIRALWPPWAPLRGTTRPLVQATIALNHAVSGLNTWSYHIVNIGLHLGAALALFGVARRTLARYPATAERAAGLAAAGATIWAVHPLQTESVTYIIQRAEVAMGLAVFLMLYCFQRATESERPSRWLMASIASCLLGYAAKPTMIIAPLLLWLFDRQFVIGTFRGALRSYPRFYLVLFLTPLVVPLLLAGNTVDWKDSAGVGTLPVTWYEYAATQPQIILHYLRLTVWPAPLCLDYGWTIERSPLVIAATSLVILGLLALSLWGLMKMRPWGFLGAWFFVNLAPTSSLIPIADLAFEHRMYLALAGVVFAAVVAVYLATRSHAPFWLRPALAVVAITCFTTVTVIRNRDYSSAVRLWTGNVAARPEYARARNNLGLELARVGQFDEAIRQLRRAIELKPAYAIAHFNLGKALLDAGQPAEARGELEISLKLSPDDPRTHAELGRAFQQLGDRKAAVAHFANATRLNQGDINSWLAFASALIEIQRYADAVKVLDQASRLHPGAPDICRPMAILLAASPDDRVRDPERALMLAQQTVAATRGSDFVSIDALGMAQAEQGDFEAAAGTTVRAIALAREQGASPAVIAPMEARIARYRVRQPWRLEAPAAQ
jgi:tetratricopeptide (TPR) repeat protein